MTEEDDDSSDTDADSPLLKRDKDNDQSDSGDVKRTYPVNKVFLLARVEPLLHGIYSTIASYRTQQEISDAIKTLEAAEAKLLTPAVDLGLLIPHVTNSNRKGRKSKRSVKSGTGRLKIQQELFDGKQKQKRRV